MNTNELKNNIEIVLKANLVPFIVGQPGSGKSEVVAQVAKDMGAYLIDMRLAQLTPEDLNGLPFPDEETGTFSYFPLGQFPLKEIHDKPKKPVIIFLDELSSCAPDVQVSAYRLILDRQVGEYDLHDNVYIIGAGNREEDNAVVQSMSTALRSRMVHFELQVSTDSWLKWASQNGVDERVIAFINYAPNMLNTFSTFESEDTLTYATPRTIVMLSKVLEYIKKVSVKHTELITGIVGTKAGTAFISFVTVFNKLPSFEEIVKNPRKIKVSDRGDINVAIVATLNNRVSRTTIKEVCIYVNRLPLEYQTLFYKTLTYNNKLLLISSHVKNWIANNSELF